VEECIGLLKRRLVAFDIQKELLLESDELVCVRATLNQDDERVFFVHPFLPVLLCILHIAIAPYRRALGTWSTVLCGPPICYSFCNVM